MSGGNAQKVVLAKWLETKPDVLLLHEPTQGVDIAARSQIYGTLAAAADAGTSVVWVSSDFDELAATCDRIVVLGNGQQMSEIAAPTSHPRRSPPPSSPVPRPPTTASTATSTTAATRHPHTKAGWTHDRTDDIHRDIDRQERVVARALRRASLPCRWRGSC